MCQVESGHAIGGNSEELCSMKSFTIGTMIVAQEWRTVVALTTDCVYKACNKWCEILNSLHIIYCLLRNVVHATPLQMLS